MTKLVGEELCRIYQNEGLKVKILRLPIVYGPDDRHHKVATRIMNAIKSGFKAKIDNKKKFYFAYVTDIAKVIENEVDMMMGNIGKKSSLMTLDEGIRKFLHEEKK
jgi:nucleoside-diphosphate-sugar epimerase